MCELSLARGIPVLQAWATTILNTAGHRKQVRSGPFREYFMQGAWFAGVKDQREVLPETRVSFERAFGLSVEDQLVLERGLKGVGSLAWERVPWNGLADLPPGVTASFEDSR